MTVGFLALLDGVVSDAKTLGVFETVNTHEPKSAPVSRGVICSIWVETIRPVNSSGLNSTSAVVIIKARVSTNMLQEPQDDIDKLIVNATDVFMGALIGGFTLNGAARDIDVRGSEGQPLSADASYTNLNGKMFRDLVITIPIIVNDCWTEVA